ncbi:MAG: hypothetical protein WAO02_09795 [Verrucomicrobiia bacterium]
MMIQFKPSDKRNAVDAFTLKEVLPALALLAMVTAGLLMVTVGLLSGPAAARHLAKFGSITLAARELASQGANETRAAQEPSRTWPMTNGPGADDEHSPMAGASGNNGSGNNASENNSSGKNTSDNNASGNNSSGNKAAEYIGANATGTQPLNSQTVGFQGSAQDYSKPASTPGVATVVRISGDARYSLGDGNWHPLVAGKILAAGSIIQTGPDAMVDIVLGRKLLMPQADPVPNRISEATDPNVRGLVNYKPLTEQNAIRMTGDTVLAIDKLTVSDTGLDSVSDTELDLRQGGIYNSVKKLSGASQYLIKIPNGIAGVRGTLFYIDASGRCAVFRSSVMVSLVGKDGKPGTVLVGEGSEFDPQSGQTSPLSPGLISNMSQIFKALCTMYYGIVNFTFDTTSCPISPTAGRNTH